MGTGKMMALILLCALSGAVFMRCSVGELAGSGSSSGNAKVVGKIVDKYCNPAKHAYVYLIPQEYNPAVEESFPDSLIDTTDENGWYEFTLSGSGQAYNLYAAHSSNNTRLFYSGIITTGEGITVPTRKLNTPGTIKALLPDSIDTAGGCVFIPGTHTYVKTEGNAFFNAGNYVLYLKDIPTATFGVLYYLVGGDPENSFPITANAYTVPMNDTVTVGAYSRGFVYNHYNSGLPNNGVWSVAVDRHGNKWFGTNSGEAVRFDGVHWRTYSLTHLGIRHILCIAADRNGVLWFGSSDAVVRFDGARWTVYDRVNSNFPGGSVYTIAVDGNNTLWMAVYMAGLVRFDGSRWTVYNYNNSGMPSSYAYDVAIDRDGVKWVATRAGVARFDNSRWTRYSRANSPLPSDTVFSVGIDREGNRWFGTYRGQAAKFGAGGWEVFNRFNSSLSGLPVHAIVADANNTVWFGTESGNLVRYADRQWSVYSASNSNMPLFANQLYKIAIDQYNNKWVTMNGGGVIVFGPETRMEVSKK